MEKFKEIVIKIMLFVLLIFISSLIFTSTFENGILLSIASIIIIYLFVEKIEIKNFTIFLIVFAFLSKLAAVMVLKIPLRGDYWLMFNASKDVLKGNFAFTKDSYFGAFGYQIFNVLYQALILKVFKYSFTLKVLNCIYSTVITYLLYKISKKVSSEKSARIVSLIYTISLYPIYLNTIFGNQQLSLMLILLGVYIILNKEDKIKWLLLAGLLLALGNLERSEGIIYIATIFAYQFFTSKKIITFAKKTLPILIVYFSVIAIANTLMVKLNINEIGFTNANPEWKLVCGLNYEHSGKFNYDDETNYIYSKELERKVIKERLTDFKTLPGLFYRKIKVQFLYNDLDQTFQVNNTKQFSSYILTIILNYIKTINIFVIFFAFLGMLKKRKRSDWELFIIINFILYFIAYLFIEVNARYYYNPQIDILIFASIGIESLINFKNNLKKKKIAILK